MRETITSNPSEISKLFPLSESKAKHLQIIMSKYVSDENVLV